METNLSGVEQNGCITLILAGFWAEITKSVIGKCISCPIVSSPVSLSFQVNFQQSITLCGLDNLAHMRSCSGKTDVCEPQVNPRHNAHSGEGEGGGGRGEGLG